MHHLAGPLAAMSPATGAAIALRQSAIFAARDGGRDTAVQLVSTETPLHLEHLRRFARQVERPDRRPKFHQHRFSGQKSGQRGRDARASPASTISCRSRIAVARGREGFAVDRFDRLEDQMRHDRRGQAAAWTVQRRRGRWRNGTWPKRLRAISATMRRHSVGDQVEMRCERVSAACKAGGHWGFYRRIAPGENRLATPS